MDVPNVVLEWSDISEPLYDMMQLSNTDKVVYLGGLDYYKDNGGALRHI